MIHVLRQCPMAHAGARVFAERRGAAAKIGQGKQECGSRKLAGDGLLAALRGEAVSNLPLRSEATSTTTCGRDRPPNDRRRAHV